MTMKKILMLIRRACMLLVGVAVLSPVLSAVRSEPATPPTAAQQAVVISGACDIADVVDRYRAPLGPDNGDALGSHRSGRREIDWDGVPDQFAAPNFLPAGFFNSLQRARGAHLSTPGLGVQVSARRDNPTGTPVRFGHINPTYPAIFRTFSEERLFSPIGSNVVDLTFFVPGTGIPAVTRGFGAVYTDVDLTETAFEYFDRNGQSLGRFSVPLSNSSLSFLGVAFDQPVVARVRIEYGTGVLGPNDSPDYDVAVMDDFIYGEPRAAGP